MYPAFPDRFRHFPAVHDPIYVIGKVAALGFLRG